MRLLDFFRKKPKIDSISVNDLTAYAGQQVSDPWQLSIFDGGKFDGGFGDTQLYQLDYWTLRQRSSQLFRENIYGRGIIDRLITNEINVGLSPEAAPDEQIIGLPDDSLSDWTELVENRFGTWAKNAAICDYTQRHTFGAIQREARMEALITGDVLVVLRHSRRTGVPAVQLVGGDKVKTPLNGYKLRDGHTITHGVERDAVGRHIAYWVMQDDLSFKRLPAYGEKSGRKIAWLVYGTSKRMDDVRGAPLLSLILQSLKEIDRYRDSAQRKAVINSILAVYIKKGEDKMGTLPVTGGAVRRGQEAVTTADGKKRMHDIAKQIPGVVMEELQTGEEPVGFHSQGTDINFPVFETAIINAIAWAVQIPPEIMRLAFSSNYSASAAAINEFKMYLNLVWVSFGEEFCSPIYTDWLISELLSRKIEAPGLLEAWRDPKKHDVYGAWLMTDWYGSIKPSVDIVKQVKGSKMLIESGLSTHAREARITTGTKFSKNVKRLKKEISQLADVMKPLHEMREAAKTDQGAAAVYDAVISAFEDVDIDRE